MQRFNPVLRKYFCGKRDETIGFSSKYPYIWGKQQLFFHTPLRRVLTKS
jgi:hypothetical protein